MKMKSTILLVIILLIIGIFVGNFIFKHKAKEGFYSDYNALNEDYKKVLYSTGQEQQDSFELMNNFEVSFDEFKNKYYENPIDDITYQNEWMLSIDFIESSIGMARISLDSGDLAQAHLDLEEIRNEWQKVFIRNEMSMLGVYLTDFHDKMEIAIEIEESEFSLSVLQIHCDTLDESLKTIENTKTNNDNDYMEKLNNLRTSLDEFCQVQNYSTFKEKGPILKKAFISLYLKYG